MFSSCSPSVLALEKWSGCNQSVRTQLPALLQQHQDPEAHSQAMADAPQAQTEHQDMPQSLQLKGEEEERRRKQGQIRAIIFISAVERALIPLGLGSFYIECGVNTD